MLKSVVMDIDKNLIVTRMAPSPTGELHIGGLRTLLFNYALAKKNQGKFILRIEDTDQKRLVEGSMGRILEVISEYGLDFDEGPDKGGTSGPYIQSQRLGLYQDYADRLIQQGKAYYCFCPSERLAALRDLYQKEGKTFKYDRACLNLTNEQISEKMVSNQSYTVRLKIPEDQEISFFDETLGEIKIHSADIDDQVLIKSDGFPTYHHAVVVDDHLMGVTHILRGIEWLPSTPKQVILYSYFGWEAPKFVHLPNLKRIGSNKKLSKREGDVYAIDFLKKGYLPEAVLNFIMFLGWNPGSEKEIYSIKEFINDFSLEGLQKTDLVSFNIEKLDWYNKQYLHSISSNETLRRIKYWSQRFNQPCLVSKLEKMYSEIEVLDIIQLIKERMLLLSDFDNLVDYFITEPNYDFNTLHKYSDNPEEILSLLKKFLEERTFESSVEFNDYLHQRCSEAGYSNKEFFMTVRIAITGDTISPPITNIIYLLGFDKAVSRIHSCLNFLNSHK